MKTLTEVFKQKPVYLNDWTRKLDVIADFEGIYHGTEAYLAKEAPYPNVAHWKECKAEMETAVKKWENINILFASYSCASYSGDAFVLLEKDGDLYEVNAGHCSCYGLEDQFKVEPTSIEALAHRLDKGTLGDSEYSDNVYAKELREFLGLASIKK